ncbi:MAG TPA: hypothetical protein DCY13_11005 [Verrucomicrobiales bacterium]|nr:hypothetical protein [Verrucomicrobiales bacterium]
MGQSNNRQADVGANIVAIVWIVLMFLGVGWGIASSVFGIGAPKLDIVASAQRAEAGWNLSGRVLFRGAPVATADVWAVISDDRGNRLAPLGVTNLPAGGFQIDGIPASIGAGGSSGVVEATIHARARVELDDQNPGKLAWVEGRESLAMGEAGGTRWVELPLKATIPLFSIFFGSVVLALISFKAGSLGLKVQYYASVALALVLTAAMIIYISIGLRQVNLLGTKGEVVSLGFANIYHGTYVRDVEPEWLLSLTAPAPRMADGKPDPLVEGFGAPLWVLFVAVVGGGIFTVLIVMRGINEPVDFAKKEEVSHRVEEVVRHQFYILFSPVGAIFVYQLLVAGGMASRPISVALVALAAGVSLNLLLDKALAMIKSLFEGANKVSGEGSGSAGGS